MQCQKLKTYMETGRVVFLPGRSIRPNPAQPRHVFRADALEELAESIRQHGILQPLTVRRVGGSYELIAGERRLRAAQLAGLAEVPCIIMNMDARESSVAALVENLQRQDLDYIDEAKGIASLMQESGLRQEQTAALLGKSQSAVANKLRILRHGDRVLHALREKNLSERHARALLKLPEEGQKMAAIEKIAELSMNVARTEQYIDQLLAEKASARSGADVGQFLTLLNRSVQRIQRSGVALVSKRLETEKEIVVTITISKEEFVNITKT